MLNQKLVDFDEEIKSLHEHVTKATVDFYQTIERKYLPTPTKIHYVIRRKKKKQFIKTLLCSV